MRAADSRIRSKQNESRRFYDRLFRVVLLLGLSLRHHLKLFLCVRLEKVKGWYCLEPLQYRLQIRASTLSGILVSECDFLVGMSTITLFTRRESPSELRFCAFAAFCHRFRFIGALFAISYCKLFTLIEILVFRPKLRATVGSDFGSQFIINRGVFC